MDHGIQKHSKGWENRGICSIHQSSALKTKSQPSFSASFYFYVIAWELMKMYPFLKYEDNLIKTLLVKYVL